MSSNYVIIKETSFDSVYYYWGQEFTYCVVLPWTHLLARILVIDPQVNYERANVRVPNETLIQMRQSFSGQPYLIQAIVWVYIHVCAGTGVGKNRQRVRIECCSSRSI